MKKETIINKYHKRCGIKMNTINSVYKLDETPTKKYVAYILYQYYFRTKYIIELTELCMLFEKYLPYIKNKDIYHADYNFLSNLKNVIGKAILMSEIKRGKNKERNDIFILKETKDYILLQPRTFEASKKYGYGTRWCTTSFNNDRYYQKYKKYLVYLIYKDVKKHKIRPKVAFYCNEAYFKGIEIYNPEDDNIGTRGFMSKEPNAKNILSEYKKFIKRDKFMWYKKLFKNSYTSRDLTYIEQNLKFKLKF